MALAALLPEQQREGTAARWAAAGGGWLAARQKRQQASCHRFPRGAAPTPARVWHERCSTLALDRRSSARALSSAEFVMDVHFGYWMPLGSGGMVISSLPQRTDWTLE
ncbi:hypothetical protein WMF37_32425 [Sorangium sp. So ce291]|uniref:hypothetical protein n=1 Tax=Sorangium sp. So ce291 TaxID=3133294 RepID=UPI003F603BB6